VSDLAYQLGCRAAVEKLGGYRVPVTDDQTPQAESYKATNAQAQELNVNDLWERHDKRQKEFVQPGWLY
jgi:hypothetical protein